MIEYERSQGGQSVEIDSGIVARTRDYELDSALANLENEWPEDNDENFIEYNKPNVTINTRRLFGHRALIDTSSINLHHTLFNRVAWAKYPLTRKLRRNPATHIRLPVYIHDELHDACSSILLPTLSVAEFALSRLGNQPRTYQKLDRIKDLADRLRTIEGGEGMADGLAQQLPFLTEGNNLLKRKVL